MIYLYVTPSGYVNLIEGDKIPSELGRIYGSESIKQAWYQAHYNVIQRCKASSVPVDDQERAKKLCFVNKRGYATALDEFSKLRDVIPADTIYGPFDIEYRIHTSGLRHAPDVDEVAILLPETDEDPIIQHKGKEYKFKLVPECEPLKAPWDCLSREQWDRMAKHYKSTPSEIAKVTPSNSVELKQEPLKDPWDSAICTDCGRPRKGVTFCGSTFHHQIKLTPEQAKEREEAINWYRGEPNELINAQQEYINILSDEIDSLVSIAHVHGWRSNNFEKGKAAREKIEMAKAVGNVAATSFPPFEKLGEQLHAPTIASTGTPVRKLDEKEIQRSDNDKGFYPVIESENALQAMLKYRAERGEHVEVGGRSDYALAWRQCMDFVLERFTITRKA